MRETPACALTLINRTSSPGTAAEAVGGFAFSASGPPPSSLPTASDSRVVLVPQSASSSSPSPAPFRVSLALFWPPSTPSLLSEGGSADSSFFLVLFFSAAVLLLRIACCSRKVLTRFASFVRAFVACVVVDSNEDIVVINSGNNTAARRG